MGVKRNLDSRVPEKGSGGRGRRQLAAVFTVLILLGCGSDDEEGLGTIGYVEGFLGGVAADEPKAAQIGRDVLASGGSAADAVTAMYFAMAVTLPSQASLGGGGVCVAYDSENLEVRALDFLARAPARIPPGADRPTAVPANARGFFALHARFGRLRWSQLLAPAENLARFGVQVSRAFGQDLKQVHEALLTEPDMRRIFKSSNTEQMLTEGDFVRQTDLSAVISNIRANGPGSFYTGPMARQLVDAVKAAGGSLESSDLQDYQPVWRDTIRLDLGRDVVHFTPPPPAGGAVAAQMWAMLGSGDRFEDASPEERPHLIAEASLRAFSERERWAYDQGLIGIDAGELVADYHIDELMESYRPDLHVAPEQLGLTVKPLLENPSAASMVAVDNSGSAAACAVTLNSLFGTGRVAPGTGIVLASLPGQGGRGATGLGPMLVVNDHTPQFRFAAAASGGAAAPVAMVQVAAETLLAGVPLKDAIAMKRVLGGGDPDVVYFEQLLPGTDLQSLSQRGHQLVQILSAGKVNAISCPGTIPERPDTCVAATDPRGFGLAATAD